MPNAVRMSALEGWGLRWMLILHKGFCWNLEALFDDETFKRTFTGLQKFMRVPSRIYNCATLSRKSSRNHIVIWNITGIQTHSGIWKYNSCWKLEFYHNPHWYLECRNDPGIWKFARNNSGTWNLNWNLELYKNTDPETPPSSPSWNLERYKNPRRNLEPLSTPERWRGTSLVRLTVSIVCV